MANLSNMVPEIQRNYKDYSNVPDEAIDIAAAVQMGNTQQPFPVKLHYMLDEVENQGLDDIVGWEVHGRCFKIYDQKRFVEEILPSFFRQTKYASFQRQLNLYEFRRLTIGQDRGAYYHEMFLKGRPGLALRMRRTKFKGKGPRKPASPQSEPNFYHMLPIQRDDDEAQYGEPSKPSQSVERVADAIPSNFDPLQLLGYQAGRKPQPGNEVVNDVAMQAASSGNLTSVLDQLLYNSIVGMPVTGGFRYNI